MAVRRAPIVLACLLACTAKQAPDESDRVSAPALEPLEPLVEPALPEPAAEPPVPEGPPLTPNSHLNVHDRLYAELGPNSTIALFVDDVGVIAVSDTGKTKYVTLEPFSYATVDYQSGLLWLERSWDREHRNGLFVADLFAPQLELQYVNQQFRRSWNLTNAAGETYPIGDAAFTTVIGRHGVRTVGKHCERDLCEVPREVAEYVTTRVKRGYPVEPSPRLEVMGVDNYRIEPTSQEYCEECGHLVDLPGIRLKAISVEVYGDLRHVFWNLYDPDTKEFIATDGDSHGIGEVKIGGRLARSKTPWDHYAVIWHLMICEDGKAIVLRDKFVTPEGELIYEGPYDRPGVCLHGGAVFDDRDIAIRDDDEFEFDDDESE